MQGNPELLRRAVENIVRNAIRYSPEEGTVQITLKRSGSLSGLRSIWHRCAGRSPHPHFDPFYRVEKDRGEPAEV